MLLTYHIDCWHTLGTVKNIMATITKRGDYQYRAQIRRNGYPPVYKTFIYLADAEVWARFVESQMDQGTYQENTQANAITIEKLAKKYLKEMTPSKKNSVEETRLMNVVIKEFGQYHLSNIKSTMVKSWLDGMKKQGKAGSTINHHLSTLSVLIDTAMKDWGYKLPENPCKMVKRMPAGKPRDRRLLPGEENRIVFECINSRNQFVSATMKLAIETGMRQGEIFGLLWENVDLKRAVAKAIDTKNGDDRDVPLSTRAIAIFKSLPQATEGKIMKCSQHGVASSLRNAISRARTKYLNECCETNQTPIKGFLENLRPHDLRHEATSRFFEMELDIMEVASITGHKTLQMLKRYTHLRPENLAKKLG